MRNLDSGFMPVILGTPPQREGLRIPKPTQFTTVTLKSYAEARMEDWAGRHTMSDAIKASNEEEYCRKRMEIELPKVEARNRVNVKKFLRFPPTIPGQFFMVKANYLWHECTWVHLTLEAAFNDATNDCDAATIKAPNGNTVEVHEGMTLEQVRFILDGNHVALSDGAL